MKPTWGRKVLAFLVSASMVVGLMPSFAYAETDAAAPDTSEESGVSMPQAGGSLTVSAPTRATTVQANSWDDLQTAINDAADGTEIQLGGDLECPHDSGYIDVKGDKSVTIDLAGHRLDRKLTSNKNSGYVIEVSDGATLAIRDSSDSSALGGSAGTGTITGGFSTKGGGIYVKGGATLSLEGGTITRNIALSEGGGIYADKDAILYMSGGNVADNTAYDAGGGIYADKDAILNMSGGNVADNIAYDAGGGIYLKGSLFMSGGTVIHNTVKGNVLTKVGSGGGICVDGGTLNMTGGTIVNNIAKTHGGGIYVHSNGTIELHNAAITWNIAGGNGGGIYMGSTVNAATIENCTIEKNRSEDDCGGGLYMDVEGTTLKIDDSNINGNEVGGDGAGIYLEQGSIEMNGGAISKNIASGDSGGVKVTKSTYFTANNVTISGNKATGDEGGGIKNYGVTWLTNCEVTENEAEKEGGGIYNDDKNGSDGTLVLSGCFITDNICSDSNGGGIYSDKSLKITGGSISRNTAPKGKGGGLYLDDGSDDTFIAGSIEMKDNTASLGKDLYLDSGQKLTLDEAIDGTYIGSIDMKDLGVFTQNYSRYHAGVHPSEFFDKDNGAFPVDWTDDRTEARLYTAWPELQQLIDDTPENGKLTLSRGYTAASSDTRLKISKNITINLNGYTLDRNLPSKKDDGHVLEVLNGTTLVIVDELDMSVPGGEGPGTITGGYSKGGGGGVFVNGGATLSLDGGTVSGNNADVEGGGIYVNEGAILNMSGGTVADNTASEIGGGIYVKGSLNMTGGTVSGNTAKNNGGGIYVDGKGTILHLDDASILGNSAKNNGGGVYTCSKADSATIARCAIAMNKAEKGSGGGLYMDTDGKKLTIEDSHIEGNTAGKASAGICFNKGSIEMKRTGSNRSCTLSGNIAYDGSGGGIVVPEGATFTATDVVISGNQAANGEGGGIESKGTLTLTGCKITDNTANGMGGGVNTFGTATLTSCIISGNAAKKAGGGIHNTDAFSPWIIDIDTEDEFDGGVVGVGDLKLENCTVSNNNAGHEGGGVYSNKKVAFVGGNVFGNHADTRGGGIFVGNGSESASIEGGLTVRDNSATLFGNDVFLRSGKKLACTGALGADSAIAVDLESGTGVLTDGYGAHNGTALPEGRFVSATGYGVILEDGEVKITSKWGAIKSEIESASDGATITLNEDYAASADDSGIVISKDHRVTVDLNGHTLNRNRMSQVEDGYVFKVAGTLTIRDHSASDGNPGTGTITGGWTTYGGGVFVDNWGTLNLEAGTISGNKAAGDGGGIFVRGWDYANNYEPTCNFNMTGGAIKGNSADYDGGGIYMASPGYIDLEAGSVTDNSAQSEGGGICVVGLAVLHIKGNLVVKGNEAETGDDVYLLYNIAGLSIDGELTEGARIGIATNWGTGVFTNQYSSYNNTDPARYFVSTQGYEIVEEHGEAVMRVNTYGETDYEYPFVDRNNQINIDTESLTGSNWMSGISGERYLNEINMPGSHDSAMNNIQNTGGKKDVTSVAGVVSYDIASHYAKTQYRNIDQQLAEGARQLDLRLNDCYKELKWYGAWDWADDGENLWLAHGTSKIGGNYLAWDDTNDDFLSFTRVLEWVTDFLEKHPTETVILNIRPETPQSGHGTKIYQRARTLLEQYAANKVNSSTGESFLYKEPGSSSYFTPYTYMPQLKDCRGKIVLLPNDEKGVNICGGFNGERIYDDNFIFLTSYTKTSTEKVTEIETLYTELNGDGETRIPTGFGEDLDFLWYWELNCTGEDQGYYKNYTSYVNPVNIASYVNPSLIGDDKLLGTSIAGQYIGWLRMDAFLAEHAKQIWRTNFFDSLEENYCTITVKSNLDDPRYPDQTFTVLKGTTIKVPENIYRQLENKYLYSWEVTGTNSGMQYPTSYPDQTFTVAEDVTFTAQWLAEGKVPIKIVWKDGDNFDGLRPPSVDMTVTTTASAGDGASSGETTKTVTVSAAQGWRGAAEGSIESMSIEAQSWDPSHQIGADAEGRYSCAVGKEGGALFVITFTHTPQATVEISGKIDWEDSDDANGKRPEGVRIHLRKNGHVKESGWVSADENGIWKYDFGKFSLYENGEKIKYSIAEDPIKDENGELLYSIFVDGFDVTNTYVAGKENAIDIMGIVEWDDADDVQGLRPEKITVRLKRFIGDEPEEVVSQEIAADENGYWSFRFDDVDFYDSQGDDSQGDDSQGDDSQGEVNVYAVAVDEIPGYESAVGYLKSDKDDQASGAGSSTSGAGDGASSGDSSIADEEGSVCYSYLITNTLVVHEEDKALAKVQEDPEACELTYDGEEHTLIEGGSGYGGTLVYALVEDGAPAPELEDFSEELPTATDAGTYNVWYCVSGDILHKASEPVSMAVTIAPRQVTFTGASATKVYTGSEFSVGGVTESGLLPGHTHNVEFSAKGADVGEHEGAFTDSADITIKSGEDNVTANYELIFVPGVLTIEQDPDMVLEITSFEGAAYTYDGEPHALPAGATTNALSGKTKIEYSKDGEEWTEDLASLAATDVADSCTIQARATNPNYAGPAEGSAELAITKRPVAFAGVSETRTYTGSEIGISGVAEDGLVDGHTHNVEFSAKGTDVGEYEGAITDPADVAIMSGGTDVTANYEVAVEDGALTIEQDPDMVLEITSFEGAAYTYDGEPHALPAGATTNALSGETTVEYSKDGEEWTEDLASLAATDVADSCTIQVRATNPNYAGPARASAELAVEPAKAEIAVDDASKIEGQADPAFAGTVSGLVAEGDLGEVRYVRTNDDEAPGAYEGVLTAEYTANPNYDVAVENGDFTITEAPAGKGVYKFTSGAGGTYTQGSGRGLGFRIERTAEPETAFVHFTGIEVDGKAVPEKDASGRVNWTAESGSVVLELQPGYLDGLGKGGHTVSALFDDGDAATAEFSVAEKAAPSPTPTPDPDDNKSDPDNGNGNGGNGSGGNGNNGASAASAKGVSAKTGDSLGAAALPLAIAAGCAICLAAFALYRRRRTR